MSVQNEIERINNNVQAALSVVADAGVSVPENANSNNLPAAVSALANEKQDKLTGTKGQIVGFDSDGKPVAQDKTSYGVATLGADGKLTGTQVPMQQIIAVTNAAEYSATATYALGDYCTYDGKLYRCTTVITEAEAWTAAHWTETTMGAELVSIYTTLQNKAPSGFGYGDTQNIVFWDDEDGTKLEQALDARFAPSSMRDKVFRANLVDYPICKVSGNGGFADILADSNNDSNGYPNGILIVYYARSGSVNGPAMATKQKINGTWYPWEYVNPPMELGKEYRTTERYLGKPVYVKVVDCGQCPASGFKDIQFDTSGVALPIRCYGNWTYGGRSTIPFETHNSDRMVVGMLGTTIRITTGGDNFSSHTCTVTAYYTKTTD